MQQDGGQGRVRGEEAERGQCRTDRGGRRRRGIDQRAGAVHKQIPHRFGARHEAAIAAQRLAQRAHGEVDRAFQRELADQPAALRPEHTGRVCFVHHQHRLVMLGHAGDFAKRRDIPVHAEHGFRDHEFLASSLSRQQIVQMSDVVVLEAMQRRAAQGDGIEDARVRETVGKHRVVAADERRNDAGIRHVSASKQQCGGITLVPRDATFQFIVDVQRSGQEARGARTHAVPLRRFRGGLDDERVIGEIEVVVGREIEVRTVPDAQLAAAGRIHDQPSLEIHLPKPADLRINPLLAVHGCRISFANSHSNRNLSGVMILIQCFAVLKGGRP
ncbi:MAG: hypothetical protein BWY59_01181 [Verrucomicrobia bacterium ADurb.Bin345]|nr:MAG: hypothetical protein BWY59_01181 [Verrucomicrobia bacterium ADurb.Bin345]